jgi:hypothetical protein
MSPPPLDAGVSVGGAGVGGIEKPADVICTAAGAAMNCCCCSLDIAPKIPCCGAGRDEIRAMISAPLLDASASVGAGVSDTGIGGAGVGGNEKPAVDICADGEAAIN